MPDGTGLVEFSRRFPDRFFDVGIAEEHAVSFAAGLALGGLVPVVAIYSSFLQRAVDQILHDVLIRCAVPLMRCPFAISVKASAIFRPTVPSGAGSTIPGS